MYQALGRGEAKGQTRKPEGQHRIQPPRKGGGRAAGEPRQGRAERKIPLRCIHCIIIERESQEENTVNSQFGQKGVFLELATKSDFFFVRFAQRCQLAAQNYPLIPRNFVATAQQLPARFLRRLGFFDGVWFGCQKKVRTARPVRPLGPAAAAARFPLVPWDPQSPPDPLGCGSRRGIWSARWHSRWRIPTG